MPSQDSRTTSAVMFVTLLCTAKPAQTLARTVRMTSGLVPNGAAATDFYKAIGSPTYVAAPMVEQSEKAFRLLCRRHGCDLAYTQMLHAQQFSMLKAAKFRHQHFDGDQVLEGEDPQEDRPLIAQFCGNDPELLVKAARYVEHQVEACDLNLGCPQQIAKKGNYGAYLLPQGDLCERLIDAMASQLACPVTVKIRCLSTVEETVKLALRLEGAGVQLITVHGRTVRSAKTDNGPADWSIIREVKAALRIPVVANGGIETFADAERCLALTGADAIMSSEALLEDPALFDRSLPGLHEVSGAALAQRQLALAGEYLQLVQLYPPAIGAGPVRAHLFKMLHRLLGCHTDLRGRLANGRESRGAEGLQAVVRELGQRYWWDLDAGVALVRPEECPDVPIHGVSWYRRHRHEEEPVATGRVLMAARARARM